MAEIGYLTSALVTGGLLLAVWVLVSRMENWRSYDPAPSTSTGRAGDWLNTPTAWTAGFFLLAIVAGGGAVLLVSDVSLLASVSSWVVISAIFAVLLGGFALWGTYSSVRHRGHHSARAVMVSAWLFGALFVGAITVKLLIAG